MLRRAKSHPVNPVHPVYSSIACPYILPCVRSSDGPPAPGTPCATRGERRRNKARPGPCAVLRCARHPWWNMVCHPAWRRYETKPPRRADLGDFARRNMLGGMRQETGQDGQDFRDTILHGATCGPEHWRLLADHHRLWVPRVVFNPCFPGSRPHGFRRRNPWHPRFGRNVEQSIAYAKTWWCSARSVGTLCATPAGRLQRVRNEPNGAGARGTSRDGTPCATGRRSLAQCKTNRPTGQAAR
jgi:hypothetical protein